MIVLVLVACSDDGAGVLDGTLRGDGKQDSTEGSPDAAICLAAPVAMVALGSTRKVCQLTGDNDRQLGTPTLNRTETRFGLWGTDLGASFEHGGATYLLFGDSIPTSAGTNPAFGDAIATTADTDPSDCLTFDVASDAPGTYRSPVVPGVDLGEYEVPLDGLSVEGRIYMWFSTSTMTRSVLARSDDGGGTFTKVHDLSASRLVNVSAVRDGDDVLLFGSGTFRGSEVFLAKVPAASIEDRAAYRFYAGVEADGCTPRWTTDEATATPLFGPACVGELSAHHLAALDAWVVAYDCDEPRGIQVRIARTPTGPWSEQVTMFEPWADGGYCGFMHTSYANQMCDIVHDPGRETIWGGEYGPYLIESLTQPIGEHSAALHFVLSTWNPYQTMLMRTELSWQ